MSSLRQLFNYLHILLALTLLSSTSAFDSNPDHSDGKLVDSCLSKSSQPPTIDIARLFDISDISLKNDVTNTIGMAARKWGFFHVVNHGIPKSLINDFLHQLRVFFNSSNDVKMSVKRNYNNSRGYANDEFTKQKIDAKQIFDVGHKPFPELSDNAFENVVIDGFNQWPTGPDLENFKSIIEKYYSACTVVAGTILNAIARDLEIDGSIFFEDFHNHTSFLRLNYYPIMNLTLNESVLGVSRHTDAGVLTLLLQDSVSALEVYTGTKEDNNDGDWVAIKPVEDALTVNICDMLQVNHIYEDRFSRLIVLILLFIFITQVWSNDNYLAPEHRVRASTTKERYSAPFFYNPNYVAIIKPLVQTQYPKYRQFEYAEFRKKRFLGDYSNIGKEVQIEDYLQ